MSQSDALRYFQTLHGKCEPVLDGEIVVVGDDGRTRLAIYPVNQLEDVAKFVTGKECFIKYNLIDTNKMLDRSPHAIGNSEEVTCVVGIGLDCDAGKPGYLSRSEMLEALGKMPFPPSLIVNSNGPDGGFHGYWLLNQPHYVFDESERAKVKSIFRRWQAKLKELCGGKLDGTADLSRQLRPVGSIRSSGNTVSIHNECDKRYTLSEFESCLPPKEIVDDSDSDSDEPGQMLSELSLSELKRWEGLKKLCDETPKGKRSEATYSLLMLAHELQLDKEDVLMDVCEIGKFADYNHQDMDGQSTNNHFETTWNKAEIDWKAKQSTNFNVDYDKALAELGEGKSKTEPLFPIINARELDATNYSTSFLVDGVLTSQNAILVAPSKSMKTTLCVDLGLSLAMRKPFAGKFNVAEAVRVLMMTGESGLATIQESARRIASSKGFELSEAEDNFFISDRVPSLSDKSHTTELAKLLDSLKPKVLLCDPAYMMLDGQKAENLFLMGQQLAVIARLCSDRGILIVLVHHAKQSSGRAKDYEPIELGDVSWAGFEQFCRQWILLSRREPYEPGTGDHKLWLSYGGSAGHGGLWGLDIAEGPNSIAEGRKYEIQVVDAEEARKSQPRNESKRSHQETLDQKSIDRTIAMFGEADSQGNRVLLQADILARFPGGVKAALRILNIGALRGVFQRLPEGRNVFWALAKTENPQEEIARMDQLDKALDL